MSGTQPIAVRNRSANLLDVPTWQRSSSTRLLEGYDLRSWYRGTKSNRSPLDSQSSVHTSTPRAAYKYPTVSVLPSKHYLQRLGRLLPVPGFLDTRGSYILPVGPIARTSNLLNPCPSTVSFQTLSTTFIPSFRDNVKVFLDLLILSSVRYPHSTELRILASTVLRFSHFFF